MSRVARNVVPGEPHHIVQRGNRRAAVFHADEERAAYLRLLSEYGRMHGLRLWAYCLMTNHVHLIAVPSAEHSLAHALRGVHTVYAMHYNHRHHASGHLWQGRYKSCPLDGPHLWHAVRYVERNPVRAGIVSRAQDYPWSSAPAHCGLRRDPLLAPDFPPPGAITDWAFWLTEPDDADHIANIRAKTNANRPCGSPEYLSRLEAQTGQTFHTKPPGRKPRLVETGQRDLFGENNG